MRLLRLRRRYRFVIPICKQTSSEPVQSRIFARIGIDFARSETTATFEFGTQHAPNGARMHKLRCAGASEGADR